MSNVGQDISKLPTVSACMIVKDEEHNLPRCLSSIRDVVDEIVIVDTGSSDRTVDIAKSFGAKVFVHLWEEDFSKHRNQSISYATKDWILIIDADEELKLGPGGLFTFKKFLQDVSNSKNGGHLAAACVMNDMQQGRIAMRQNTARLFRRGHIRYNGIVHNQPKMDSRATMVEESIVSITHYGYDLSFEEMQKKKTARTLPLVLKWLEKEPECLHPHFYLVQIYMETGELEKAVEHGEIYLKHRDELERSGMQNFNKTIYYSMFSAYMRLGRIEDANRLLTEGLKYDPLNLDLAYALVQYGARSGQPHLVYLGANQYVNLYDHLMADPMKRQNTFIFSCNSESYSYCLYNLALSQFRLGLEAIMKLKGVVSSVDTLYRNGILADLKSELFALGMDDLARKHIHFDQTFVVPSLVDELRAKSPQIFH